MGQDSILRNLKLQLQISNKMVHFRIGLGQMKLASSIIAHPICIIFKMAAFTKNSNEINCFLG